MKIRLLLFISILGLLPLSCSSRRQQIDARTAPTAHFAHAGDARTVNEMPFSENAGMVPELIPPGQEELATATLSTVSASIALYTDRQSYYPGDTIKFYVSTTAETYSLEIFREEWSRVRIGKVTGLVGQYHPIPPYSEKPWAQGAGWPLSYEWTIPDDWENASYLVLARTTSGDYVYSYHPFIVRTIVPGSRSKLAFVMNYNTRQAYNAWGGKSLYEEHFANDTHWAVEASFLRPYEKDTYGKGKGYWGSWELTSYLIDAGYNPEFLTEYDISQNPAVLLNYDVLVFSGHHEYISRNTFDALERHHRRGGHIAFFSANDLYWQSRFSDDGTKLICYKGYAKSEDPEYQVNNSVLTTLWRWPPVSRPPETLQGVAYVEYSYLFEDENYIVQDSDHFIFEGTGLQNGDPVGDKMAAGETDYVTEYSPSSVDIVLYQKMDVPIPMYAGYIPPEVKYGEAAATYYEDSPEYGFPDGKGGQVFSAGTHMGWGNALIENRDDYETVRVITHNIIQHMVDAPPPAPGSEELAALVSNWLGECQSPQWCTDSDLNMDGTVDIIDFSHFARWWADAP